MPSTSALRRQWGTFVGTTPAHDLNGDAITYSITAGNGDGKFAIDGSTGEITANALFPATTGTAYTLTVEAADGVTGSTHT